MACDSVGGRQQPQEIRFRDPALEEDGVAINQDGHPETKGLAKLVIGIDIDQPTGRGMNGQQILGRFAEMTSDSGDERQASSHSRFSTAGRPENP